MTRFSDEEQRIIKENYENQPVKLFIHLLPGRSITAVYAWAAKHHLRKRGRLNNRQVLGAVVTAEIYTSFIALAATKRITPSVLLRRLIEEHLREPL